MSLMSDEYRALMIKTHEMYPQWGNGGKRHYNPLVDLIRANKFETVLDFGCGVGLIGNTLLAQKVLKPEQLQMYDPGMPQYSAPPRPADLVICTDVLEHVEPEHLDGTLTFLRFLAGKMAYFNIGVTPAAKILPDGRNAHLIVQPPVWWEEKLSQHWSSVNRTLQRDGLVNPTYVCE